MCKTYSPYQFSPRKDEVTKNKLRFFLHIKTGLLNGSADKYASFQIAISY